MSIEKILKDFDEKYTMPKGDLPQGWSDDIKDFIKESIKQALDEITPEREVYRRSNDEYSSGIREGFNEAIDQLEENKAKFLGK